MKRIERMIAEHEGFRRQVYDDATGEPIRPGTVVQGWPTIGYGQNLLNPGINKAEALMLMQGRLAEGRQWANRQEFWHRLDCNARRDVILMMHYNMGGRSLLTFGRMIGAIMVRDWTTAAAEMLDSRWARQVGTRAHTLAEIMRTGAWPDDHPR